MSPRLEREAAMDDMAAWAQANRFAPIPCPIPEPRPKPRFVPRSAMSRSEAIGRCIDDRDSADVLEALCNSGVLDEQRVGEMLEANHERRLQQEAEKQA
jgi:hypothetical protein